MLASARRAFEESAVENLVITPGKWHPVYAAPSDWYDPGQLGRFQPIELDLTDRNGSGAFALLPGNEQLQWRLGDPLRPQVTKQPDTATQPTSLRFRCLQVTLERPWLDFELFALRGWYLQGQPQGYYSTGRAETNQGVLPLVPTRLLLGTDIRLDARVGADDRDLIGPGRRHRGGALAGALQPRLASTRGRSASGRSGRQAGSIPGGLVQRPGPVVAFHARKPIGRPEPREQSSVRCSDAALSSRSDSCRV